MDGTYKMSAQYFRTLHWIDIKLSTMVSVRIYCPCPSSQNFSNFFCLLSIVTFPFPEWSPRELIFSWYFIHEYPVIWTYLLFGFIISFCTHGLSQIEKSIQNEAMFWHLSRTVRKGIIYKIGAHIFFIHAFCS